MVYPIVGVLISSWFNKNKKKIGENRGTAFAVAPRIIITCTHNVFTHMIGDYASDVIFFPGVDNADDIKKGALGYRGSIDNTDNKFKEIRFEIAPLK